MRNFKKVLVMSLCAMMAMSATGCGAGSQTQDGPKGNVSKLQVASCNLGFGIQWLKNLEKKFEAAYAETEFEEGKKGVDIVVTPKNQFASTLSGSGIDVGFDEGVAYFDMAAQGKFLDITDIVTGENMDGKTIQSKLYESDQVALKTHMGDKNGKYYALPHAEILGGLVYDIDVFESKRLYFSANANNGNQGFITSLTEAKSAGPDGVSGTQDDGLPTTYDEFFKLCDYMAGKGVTPFVWSGYYKDYPNYLMNAISFNYSGKASAELNITLDSKGQLVDIVTGFNGDEPIIEKIAITPENAYLLKQQPGNYYALKFLERIFSQSKYYHKNAISNSTTHLDAQEDFVWGYPDNKPIAFLIDGAYWYNEADKEGTIQTAIDEFGEDAENRRYGWMSLPMAEGVTKQTLYSSYGWCFINNDIAGNADKVNLAKTFVQFAYADEQLCDFTEQTGTTRALNYDMAPESVAKMDNFAQYFWEYKKNAEVFSTTSANPIVQENYTAFSLSIGNSFWASTVKGDDYGKPIESFQYKKTTAKEYFMGMWKTQASWNASYGKYFS